MSDLEPKELNAKSQRRQDAKGVPGKESRFPVAAGFSLRRVAQRARDSADEDAHPKGCGYTIPEKLDVIPW